VVGYLHTGFEKNMEQKTWWKAITYPERIDYLSFQNNELVFVLAIEKLLELETPPKAQWMRTLLCELNRIHSHLIWLATAAQVARQRDDVSFVLGGYGELKDKIVSGICDMGLSHRFALLDGVTDLGSFYSLLDVFLMTSRFEGTPNVLIEAQAAACPIVTTDAGGIGETVADGVTARIVSDRSPAKLAAALVEVLDDDKWRTRAGEAGPAFVRQRFGHETMVARMLQLYYHHKRIALPRDRETTHD
jgi:glycosyltransferase involved in cell wall biosynthesis